MKFYVIDDELSVVRVLSGIIERKELGVIVGSATNPQTAQADIAVLGPDIVFVDLLMPGIDGIRLVQKIKDSRPDIRFIMVSQVSDKGMLSEAYTAGVEFFITKPINIIEVETVTKRVAETIYMEKTLSGIRNIISDEQAGPPALFQENPLKSIKYLLGVLGMLGERGTKDILALCEMVLRGKGDYDRDTIPIYCQSISEEVKMVKQRMRRAVKKGLTNIALMGLDDMSGEVFQSYSQIVYDYDAIKSEMDYLRKKTPGGGKANLDKFIEGLLIYHEMDR